MLLPRPLVPAVFVARLNRFAVLVKVDGRERPAHLPNSGRLRELLTPGRRVLLAPRNGPGRKTPYDLTLVDTGRVLACADARLPPRLVAEAVEQGRLAPFRGYAVSSAEPPFGAGRFDLLLRGNGPPCLVEAKSVTLVQKSTGLFPDAPTERGRRHLEELIRAREEGFRTAVVFVVQRGDATAFAPNEEADPAFARAFRSALARGVEAYAYRCRVTPDEVAISDAIPVRERP